MMTWFGDPLLDPWKIPVEVMRARTSGLQRVEVNKRALPYTDESTQLIGQEIRKGGWYQNTRFGVDLAS
jgi:hypothetical protein